MTRSQPDDDFTECDPFRKIYKKSHLEIVHVACEVEAWLRRPHARDTTTIYRKSQYVDKTSRNHISQKVFVHSSADKTRNEDDIHYLHQNADGKNTDNYEIYPY